MLLSSETRQDNTMEANSDVKQSGRTHSFTSLGRMKTGMITTVLQNNLVSHNYDLMLKILL